MQESDRVFFKVLRKEHAVDANNIPKALLAQSPIGQDDALKANSQ
jgi:hypothetical protein